jgi:hypothetical protein
MLSARLLAIAAVLLAALGCTRQKMVVGSAPYEGPAITVEPRSGRHTAVVAAPSSGYRVQLDKTIKKFDSTDVYMTVFPPDPAMMHAQGAVKLNLDTTVSSDERISLFARIRDRRLGREPYRFVGRFETAPAPKR